VTGDFRYHKHLPDIAAADISKVQEKDISYGASWKKRGGVGAFMMLCRKWDRIEKLASDQGYDLFKAMKDNAGDIMDDIGDLRRYLMLAEAELKQQDIDQAKADYELHNAGPISMAPGRTVPRFGDNQDMASLHPSKTTSGYEWMGARLEDNLTAHSYAALPIECKRFFHLNEQGRYSFDQQRFKFEILGEK